MNRWLPALMDESYNTGAFYPPSVCICLTITLLEDIYAGISAHGTSIRDLCRII